MKKLLLLVLVCTYSLSSYSQSSGKMNAVKVTFSEWNTTSKQFEPVETNSCNITFTLSGNTIQADDAAKSLYTTYRKTYEDKEKRLFVWSAIDERDKECLISMSFRENEQVKFAVFYDKIAISYICYPVK